MDLEYKVNEIDLMNTTDTMIQTTKSRVNTYQNETDSLQLTIIIAIVCSVSILGLAMLHICLKYIKKEKSRTIYNPIYKATVEVDIERTAGMFRDKSCDSFSYLSFPTNFLNTKIVSLSQVTVVVPVSQSTGSLKTEEAIKENKNIEGDKTIELISSKVSDTDEQKMNITESPFEHAGYKSFT